MKALALTNYEERLLSRIPRESEAGVLCAALARGDVKQSYTATTFRDVARRACPSFTEGELDALWCWAMLRIESAWRR